MLKIIVYDGHKTSSAEVEIMTGLNYARGSIGLGRLQPFENLNLLSVIDHFIGCIDQLRFWKRFNIF